MHKCSCGRTILETIKTKCSQCLFDEWVKDNPKMCEWCGKFITPSKNDRYTAYARSRFHKDCLKDWKRSLSPKVVKTVPLCKCGCGEHVKKLGRQFFNKSCYRRYVNANGGDVWSHYGQQSK